MARRRRDKDGCLSHWRATIGRDQISIQKFAIQAELLRKRAEIKEKVAGPADYEEVRQLEIQLAQAFNAEAELSQRPVKKRRVRDRVIERLWFWATRERFNRSE